MGHDHAFCYCCGDECDLIEDSTDERDLITSCCRSTDFKVMGDIEPPDVDDYPDDNFSDLAQSRWENARFNAW